MKGGKINKSNNDIGAGGRTETTDEIQYFVVFGVIDFSNGQQTSGSMRCDKLEYDEVKKQIKSRSPILLFSPVTERNGVAIELDPISINTSKYAFVTTEQREVRAFAKTLSIEGTGLVDLTGGQLKN